MGFSRANTDLSAADLNSFALMNYRVKTSEPPESADDTDSVTEALEVVDASAYRSASRQTVAGGPGFYTPLSQRSCPGSRFQL
jgi:hypothetical protein